MIQIQVTEQVDFPVTFFKYYLHDLANIFMENNNFSTRGSVNVNNNYSFIMAFINNKDLASNVGSATCQVQIFSRIIAAWEVNQAPPVFTVLSGLITARSMTPQEVG